MRRKTQRAGSEEISFVAPETRYRFSSSPQPTENNAPPQFFDSPHEEERLDADLSVPLGKEAHGLLEKFAADLCHGPQEGHGGTQSAQNEGDQVAIRHRVEHLNERGGGQMGLVLLGQKLRRRRGCVAGGGVLRLQIVLAVGESVS